MWGGGGGKKRRGLVLNYKISGGGGGATLSLSVQKAEDVQMLRKFVSSQQGSLNSPNLSSYE